MPFQSFLWNTQLTQDTPLMCQSVSLLQDGACASNLNALILAECYYWTGEYVPAIQAALANTLNESSWTEVQNPIDLKSSELAGTLALAVHLMGTKINSTLGQAVSTALYQRIYTPLLQAFVTNTRIYFVDAPNNWNSVCWNNIVLAAVVDKNILADDAATILAAFWKYGRGFMASHQKDGFYSEGPGYFSYGYGELLFACIVDYKNVILDNPFDIAESFCKCLNHNSSMLQAGWLL
jgi:hypothetical protein